MKAFLETERMTLLEFKENDHSLIKDLDSDPEVMKYLTNGVPSDDERVNRVIEHFLETNERYDGKLGYWKALNKDGSFMGWFHFRPLKKNPDDVSNIELGYRFKKDFWGQGFATEGSKALIEKARKEKTVQKVWGHAMLGNSASTRVMEKSGLQYDREEIYEAWPGGDKRSVWYCLEL